VARNWRRPFLAGGFNLPVPIGELGLNSARFGYPDQMMRPEDLTPDQHAIVDQSDDVRDPADDSDEMNDPTKMTTTYPEALDRKLEEAEAAINAHRSESDDRSIWGNGRTGREEASGLRHS
jgi:hypothetical protein